jgi:hypothetical protein
MIRYNPVFKQDLKEELRKLLDKNKYSFIINKKQSTLHCFVDNIINKLFYESDNSLIIKNIPLKEQNTFLKLLNSDLNIQSTKNFLKII